MLFPLILSPTSPTSDKKSPPLTKLLMQQTVEWIIQEHILTIYFATKYQQKQGKSRKENNNNNVWKAGKSILQVPDTGTRVLDNTRPFWRSSIVCFWMPPARSKEHKYYITGQYWDTRNVLVFTNTGMFQYLGPEVYLFPASLYLVLALLVIEIFQVAIFLILVTNATSSIKFTTVITMALRVV